MKYKFWAYGIVDKDGEAVNESSWCQDRSALEDELFEWNEDGTYPGAPYRVVRLYFRSKK